MLVGAFVRTRSIHTPFSPSVRLIISVRRSLHRLCECLWSPFSEREIFTHFIRLFICVCRLGVWGFRYVLERGVFTHFLRLFICVRLISVHVCFTAVTVRHKPSRIVAVLVNLATRLGSSQSANFFRGRCTCILPKVHFRYSFSRHDFRCDGRDSR